MWADSLCRRSWHNNEGGTTWLSCTATGRSSLLRPSLRCNALETLQPWHQTLHVNQFTSLTFSLPGEVAAGGGEDNANSHWSHASVLLLADYRAEACGHRLVTVQKPNVRSNLRQGNPNTLCKVDLIYPWVQLISIVALLTTLKANGPRGDVSQRSKVPWACQMRPAVSL